jgi:hypothetical protein
MVAMLRPPNDSELPINDRNHVTAASQKSSKRTQTTHDTPEHASALAERHELQFVGVMFQGLATIISGRSYSQ